MKWVKGIRFSFFSTMNGLNSYTKKTPGRPDNSPFFTITFFELSVTAYLVFLEVRCNFFARQLNEGNSRKVKLFHLYAERREL